MDTPRGVNLLMVLLGCSLFCLAFGKGLDIKYMDRHCGRSVKVGDAVHLKLTSMLGYAPDLDCTLVLYNEKKYKMMVRILEVDILNSSHCHTDRVEVFRDRHDNKRPLLVLCGTHAPNKTYITTRRGMVTHFVSGDMAGGEGFDLLITPFYKADECDSESFQCDNKRCISYHLACNGYNNCGDNSDETVNCGLTPGFIAAVALVSVAMLCILVFTLYAFVTRRCNSNGYLRIL